MGPWIEVYDSERVQWELRHQVAFHSAAIAAAVSVAAFIASMVGLGALPHEVLFLSLSVTSMCVAVFLTGRLFSLQSRVWCVKMSPHMIMGYNHSRKATVFAWSQVDHVEVSGECVSIVAGGHPMIEIPSCFDDFAHVSHRILDLAELHRRPIHIGGRSIAELDLFSLMPELRGVLSTPLVPGSEPA